MESLKHHWFKVPTAIRKPLIFILGTLIVVAGLLMLIFPGPGWAAIFLGFALLATEFAAAQKVNNALIGLLRKYINKAKELFEKFKKSLKKRHQP